MTDAIWLQEVQDSAELYGWDPTWFDLPPGTWDETLHDAICQLEEWYELGATGVPDESLYRRLELERSFLEPNVEPPPVDHSDAILVHGRRVRINWPKVVTADEPGGREIGKTFIRKGRRRRRYKDRSIPLQMVKRAVIHWTVTRSPTHTWRVAWGTKRSVSTHFEIGHDGTIWQLLDLAHQAFHAGIGWVNDQSVGIDLTNPVGQKATARWNDKLVSVNQPARPVVEGWYINGWNPGRFLGATPEQLEALAALLAGLHQAIGLPLEAPLYTRHNRLKARKVKGLQPIAAARVVPPGVVQHAEVLAGKWDHAGINLPQVLTRASEALT